MADLKNQFNDFEISVPSMPITSFETFSPTKMAELSRNYDNADWMYERLLKTITDFEKKLPDNMQAGGCLVSFQNTTFAIDNIGYWNPNMIVFYGTLPNGSSVQLVQHVSQLNLLLTAVPLKDPSSPRRKIGFANDEQQKGE